MYFSTSEESCECSLVACGVKISQNVGRILKIDSQKSCVRVHGSAVQLSPRMGAFTRSLAGLYPRVTRSLADFTRGEPAGRTATAQLGASAMCPAQLNEAIAEAPRRAVAIRPAGSPWVKSARLRVTRGYKPARLRVKVPIWGLRSNIHLDPAICGGGRRPRSAKGRNRRRPKASVGACRASRARTRAEAPIRVRKGPFDLPLCVSPLVCPSTSDAMLLPSSQQHHITCYGAFASCPSTLPPSIKPQPIPFPHFGPAFLGTGAAAISGRFSAPLPPGKRLSRPSLSLYLDFPLTSTLTRAASDPLPSLPFTSPGTSTSAGIGNVGGGGDGSVGGGHDDDG